jgi:hypothetical protein
MKELVMVFGAIMGALVVALIITGSVFVLRRTSGVRSKRVAGADIPGDELTQHERDEALDQLTILNQQALLREGGQFPH